MIKIVNLNKLDEVCEEFDNLLYKYQDVAKTTDKRINKLKRIIDDSNE